MDLNDNSLNSARRVNEVLQAQAKRQDEVIAASQAECKRRENVDNAQLQTAEELRKLREQFEQSQRQQAKETQKAFLVSMAALGLNALAIIVAIVVAVLD